MSRYRNQVPPRTSQNETHDICRVHRFNEASPEQGRRSVRATASVPMKPIEATVTAAVGGRPGRSPRLSVRRPSGPREALAAAIAAERQR